MRPRARAAPRGVDLRAGRGVARAGRRAGASGGGAGPTDWWARRRRRRYGRRGLPADRPANPSWPDRRLRRAPRRVVAGGARRAGRVLGGCRLRSRGLCSTILKKKKKQAPANARRGPPRPPRGDHSSSSAGPRAFERGPVAVRVVLRRAFTLGREFRQRRQRSRSSGGERGPAPAELSSSGAPPAGLAKMGGEEIEGFASTTGLSRLRRGRCRGVGWRRGR